MGKNEHVVMRRWHKGQHLRWNQRLIIERMRLRGATTRRDR